MAPSQFPRQCLPIWGEVPQPTPPPPVPDVIFIREDPVPRIRNPVPRPIPYDGPALHTRGAVRRIYEVEMLVEPVVMPVEIFIDAVYRHTRSRDFHFLNLWSNQRPSSGSVNEPTALFRATTSLHLCVCVCVCQFWRAILFSIDGFGEPFTGVGKSLCFQWYSEIYAAITMPVVKFK